MPIVQQVIVTGASSGIGRATAVRFGRAGAAVLAVGRDAGALAEVSAVVEGAGGQCAAFAADVTEAGAPARIVDAALGRFGGLTTLVNAAGIIGTGTIESTTDEQWDAMMDINSRAPFRLMRAATPALIQSKGSVVNVSSVTGLRSFPGVLSYCVSKSAIDQLTPVRGARTCAEGRARQRSEPWRRDFQPASPRRDERGKLLGVSRTFESDTPDWPSR